MQFKTMPPVRSWSVGYPEVMLAPILDECEIANALIDNRR